MKSVTMGKNTEKEITENENPESEEQEENEEESNEDNDDDDDDEDEEEEDPEDLYETAREKCAASKHCADLMATFEECQQRVTSKTRTEENCSQEILDFFHCQDTCAAKGLFSKMK